MIKPVGQVALREFHAFEAAGERFLYLVPSAGIFRIDAASSAILDLLSYGPRAPGEVVNSLSDRYSAERVHDGLLELRQIRAIGEAGAPVEQVANDLPPDGFPLTTMVLNVTNKCNLACTYCYEYGEDKIVDTTCTDDPKFMGDETARESVEFLLKESGPIEVAHLTFFGGETLLNFPVLQDTVAYARRRAEEEGKRLEFSLTTNATLLRPDIIEWLADNEIGVTVSIDGPKEMQDRMRVFHSGKGSYETVKPRIKELLKRHKTRPIGARVTLTRENLDIHRIYQHLTEEMGFWEVGFAPVTTSSGRDYEIEDEGYDRMLRQFGELARDWLEQAVENRHHGFSNVKDTLEEIHKGVSKAYPCGAGLGLMGVTTGGDVSLCHRFAYSNDHSFGTVAEGIDRERQKDFLEDHHIKNKTDCHTCWARPICSGGCYHEAHTRTGETTAPNLHFCTWVRTWTHTCLEIYGELSERNPEYLARFDH
ncbi:MAG: quinohemoprotein amine dehydrogenase maturation protein [Gemmatimonadota bacterium]|uniref:quinohemoprotein amine dehydrogenase maturation protein n=1 Tax=Candidatus Palauibacter scopulicola TaxID=3056741 RepID=UPI00239EAD4F|nr:quinohemoprotein amine dehydrogenase maturation protein [Candidatus Palauibacter scopulicola]MDE2663028.1 quinohemoprotein amine dehydrogenase maturation protein [Candidatus Palauibacter scopulicola]